MKTGPNTELMGTWKSRGLDWHAARILAMYRLERIWARRLRLRPGCGRKIVNEIGRAIGGGRSARARF